jgi:NAD(P)-dependent dehydrogenase (short-subunit alcohol dehydrogenase family)
MKTMLITGGSRGIGAATALLAARENYAVAINYKRNKEAAEAIVKTITANSGEAFSIKADLAIETDIVNMFREIDRHWGQLDVLVNNAGILEAQKSILEMDADRLNRIFSVNITGTILCTREAARRMALSRGGKGGCIINLSSIAARTGAPNEYTDYAASKGAIDSFTLGIAKELAPEGIRVNAIRPGFIYTDIHGDGGEAGRVDRIKDSLPMKRGGRAEEVAEAILWLAGEKSSYVAGSFLEMSGAR